MKIIFFRDQLIDIFRFSGFVDLEFTHSYLEHKDKYIKKGRGKQFKLAVEQCEDFVRDPSVRIANKMFVVLY